MVDWQPYVAGTIAGMGKVVAGHPLDTLKVRMQTAGTQSRATISHRNLLAGMTAPLVTTPLLGGLNFGIYDTAHRKIASRCPRIFGARHSERRRNRDGNMLSVYVAGCFSGWVVCNFTCPMNNIKVQQQTIPLGEAIGLRRAVQRVGLKGMFKGYLPHALTEGGGRGIYMLGYELSKELLGLDRASVGNDNGSDLFKRIFCGSVGGSLAWATIYPVDVIRNRLMRDWRREKYAGTLDCVQKTLLEDGVRGLYRGIGYSMVRTVPVAGVTLSLYDVALDFLRK